MMRYLLRTRAALRPFRFEASAASLGELRTRLAEEPRSPIAAVEGLVDHWRDGFDFRPTMARLDDLPQFVTEVDGAQVHFIHARSPEPGATPLLLTHGALGPLVELVHLVRPLTFPRSCGGRAADAFHVVVPSIPGFGFSGPPPGDAFDSWDLARVQRGFASLMSRLGYPSFATHVGDFVAPGPPPPQLADSPRAQLAWTLDLMAAHGHALERIDRDVLLTHVTIGWLTGTAEASARFLLENEPGPPALVTPGELRAFFRHPR